jgi:hypothetical protein
VADLLKIKLPTEEIYRPARTVLGELLLGAVDELEWPVAAEKGSKKR